MMGEEAVNELEKKIRREKTRNRIMLLVIILLLLIIFMMYFLGYRIGKINDIKVQGPNVVVCNDSAESCKNFCNNTADCPDDTNKDPNKGPDVAYIDNEEGIVKPDDKIEYTIKLTKNDVDITTAKILDIFKNLKFNGKAIIAPFSQGEYEFIIENENDRAIKYDVSFNDEDNSDISIEYKLVIDNVYKAGDNDTYVDIENMNVNNLILAAKSKSKFIIKWNWLSISDERDTAAAGKTYKLHMSIDTNEI